MNEIQRTREWIASVRELLRQPYRTALKWDESKVTRKPKGSASGGEFASSVAPGMEKDAPSAVEAVFPPHGTGFANRPRLVQAPSVSASPEAPAGESPLATHNVHRALGRFSGGVNSSLLVEMDDPASTKAVYKEESGEAWGDKVDFTNHDINRYIRNKQFSLAEREAFASDVDKALGLGLVPDTVARASLDVPGAENYPPEEEDSDGGYDEDYAREQYSEYKQKAQEEALDAVSDEMAQKFNDAQEEHAQDIEKRADELTDIWNEEVADFPDVTPYGSRTAVARHPVLPVGGAVADLFAKGPFERKPVQHEALDPLAVLDDAEVDVTAAMSKEEKARVRQVVRQRLEEGYQELGDVDPEKAREHLVYDTWLEDHQDTEAQLYESKVQSFTEWRKSQGYNSEGGGGGGGSSNEDAPHPNGGSLQRFVNGLKDDGYPPHEDLVKIAVLDYVIGTMDRHGGNIKFQQDHIKAVDHIVAIDNGYSVPAVLSGPDQFKFRSTAVRHYMNGTTAVDEDQRKVLLKALENTNWKALTDRYPGMNADERRAFMGRIDKMRWAMASEMGLGELWSEQNVMG